MSAKQKKRESRFIDELNRRSDAENDALYDSVPDSHGGTHYGTDIAKHMFAGAYESRDANVAAGAPARAYVLDRFKRDMANGKHPGKSFVVFTAGGPGSGKSETLIQGLVEVTDALVFDSTLTDLGNARELVAAAIAGGKGVQIAYVHRPVELAMKFAIERATKKGMYVAPARLGEDHWKAQNNLLILAKEFSGNPTVEILVFDNRGRKEDIRQVGHGIDFFNAPENVSERYADKNNTIRRAIEADGGEIARRMDARNVTTDKSGDGSRPTGD
ncbi:MAG: hypothetical protein LBK99_23705 [Opitutaceae bacterium]|jgi:hypothetical protein|nr:hypothetical protein [Opitutaceae bacterium]